MIRIRSLVCALAAAAASFAGTYTTVLQNGSEGYTGCTDTYIDQARGIPLYLGKTFTISWN